MSEIDELGSRWNSLGSDDPLWAALSLGGHSGASWSVDEFLASGVEEIAAAMAWVGSLGAVPERRRALDFGCGPGRLSHGLAIAGFAQVQGVDLAESMIAVARKICNYPDVCSFVQSADPHLSMVRSGSIDFAYSARVLQHMPSSVALGYIAEFVRVLSPGGWAVFQIPVRLRWTPAGLALRVLPAGIANKMRAGMEMHGTSISRVERAVGSAGGVVVARRKDCLAGPRWSSVTYAVQRRPGGTLGID